MNNYKIIENRPELSSSQIIAGMNFGVVKAGALATKITIAGIVISKTIISKGFIAAAVLASSALVYKSYTANNVVPGKNRSYIEEKVGPQPYKQGSKLQYNGSPQQDQIAEDSNHEVTTSIKPVRIMIPTSAPTGVPKEATEDKITQGVPSLTSATNIMSVMVMPTITLSSPGNAVCQPHPNTLNNNTPFNKPFKDSFK